MAAETRDRSATAERRVLVVEDDPNLAVLMVYMLCREGYQVSSIDNGAIALSAIRKFKPALLVLDLGLPGLSGDEVCKAVRRDAELAETFVLVLTALDDHEARRRVRAAGADCYMCKPFDPDRVVALIENVFATGLRHASVPPPPV